MISGKSKILGKLGMEQSINKTLEEENDRLKKAIAKLIEERDAIKKDISELISYSDEWACKYCAKHGMNDASCGIHDGICEPIWRGVR